MHRNCLLPHCWRTLTASVGTNFQDTFSRETNDFPFGFYTQRTTCIRVMIMIIKRRFYLFFEYVNMQWSAQKWDWLDGSDHCWLDFYLFFPFVCVCAMCLLFFNFPMFSSLVSLHFCSFVKCKNVSISFLFTILCSSPIARNIFLLNPRYSKYH